ncbi:MAG: hypothetical protein LBM04_05270 [Opitutaceae bacterium]|jgi:autotransporter-associated beta strand protein/predicted outer membrane repeat protein|nr:hypothetical protein [Opitutaceae bacterium]
MNTNITSSRVCPLFARVSTFRRLAVLVAAAALLTAGSVFSQTDSTSGGKTYWLSGTAGGTGSYDNPSGQIRLLKNDVVLLDANKTGNFTPFTPWVAISSTISRTSQLSNGAVSPYMGYMSGDPAIYSEIKPFARLNELIEKTPSLGDLMPSFFTQSEWVYLSARIGQDNANTPDYIKAVTSNPFGTWPISVYSSDALDPETGAPRLDMQNAAWVVLASSGTTVAQRTQLLNYFGEYVPVTGKGRPWDGSYSMITLEHVIFYGGYISGAGGAIDFKRSDGLTGNANTRAILQIKGDIAVVDNMAGQLGGGIQGQDSLQFDGNLYMVGNMSGVSYNPDEKVVKFSAPSNTSYHGNGGAMRIGSGGQIATFNKDAIFIGNMAADMGGAISLHNNSTLQFNGKAVFMGNQGGLFMRPDAGRGGGNGGAIVFGAAGNRAYFAGESYFIANESAGFGGALASGYETSDDNGFFEFSANALFMDNVSGFNPEITTVYSNTISQKTNGVFPLPRDVATAGIEDGVWSGTTIINVFSGTLAGSGESTYGGNIRGGGAFHGAGTYLLFNPDAKATFMRNSTNGLGGALQIAKNSTAQPTGYLAGFGAAFYDDAAFIGNVAAVNGGAIMAGSYGPVRSAVWEYNSGTAISASVYFGKAGAGSMLTMHGNIAHTAPKALTTDASASLSGTAYSVTLSTGTTVMAANGSTVVAVPVFGGGAVFSVGGLYVESQYSFWHNQTGGSGGALLIGSGTTPALVGTLMGTPYSLVLSALDWKPAGTYSQAGDFALFQDNVAMRDGGAIAAHDGASLYISSGAKFLDNYAGGDGGAIALAMTSGQTYGLLDAPQLDLRARVADITFQGNRAGVTIDDSVVDLDKILDPLRTNENGISNDGYMQLDPDSGRQNDIYVGLGASTGTSDIIATINMDAYEGIKISLGGGIEMDHGGTKNLVVNINTITDTPPYDSIGGTSATIAPLDNTAPVGLVVLDNASADIEGVTTIGNGTLRIQGTSNDLHWGSAASTTREGTLFDLKGAAALEANATINAGTIKLGDGATLRVLGVGANQGGLLKLNAGTGGVVFGTSLNFAGSGTLELGLGAFAAGTIDTISVGDVGHTLAQTLTIAKDASTLADITLNNIKLAVGLFDGNTSDKIEAGNIIFTGQTNISLTSLAQGTFTIASANSALSDSSSTVIDYKGTLLSSGGRMTFGTSVVGGDELQLTFTLTNQVLDWVGANVGGSLTLTSGNMTGGYADYVLGDAINFGASAANKTVSVDENVGLAGMTVTDDYTFTGTHGITTQVISGGVGNGSLTMDAVGKTLTLDNATGAGQSNDFASIIIKGGTVAAGNAAQLGAALSQIIFENTTDNGAALLVTDNMLLDGASSLNPQQLTIAANNTASIVTNATGILAVINNAVSGDGGVFNIGADAILNLNAQSDMFFLNNTATGNGGALALAANARLNVDVAADKTVMFGLQGDRELKTGANISMADSIYGAANSIIEKNGDGTLSINSNSSGFAGTLNVNSGAVIFGEGSVFGDATSRINIATGALLGGAATFGGNFTVNGGKLAIDGGDAFGRAPADSAQTLTILGNLDLTGATLIYNAMLNKSNEYSADKIIVGGIVDISGITTLEFNAFSNGISTLIQTGAAGHITLGGNTTLVSSGSFAGTDSEEWVAQDFKITKGGVEVDPRRYETSVEYAFLKSEVVTSSTNEVSGLVETTTTTYTTNGPITLAEGVVLVSQTNYYDATQLQLNAFVHNQKIHYTGASGTATWNNILQNWDVPGYDDNTFAMGDSIAFGATDENGTSYYQGNAGGRNIAVQARGILVADMTFTGSDNWTITGGEISSNAGGNEYKDENGRDLSTGQLLLDNSFTGTVSLLNSRVHFNGIYVSTGSAVTKLSDIEINNGTLLTTAKVLNGNLIWNDSHIIFQQSETAGDNDEYKDTRIYGPGDIIQRGASKITMKETGIIETSNYHLQKGTLEVENLGSLLVSGTLTMEAGTTLLLNQGLHVGTLVNKGVLRKSTYNLNNDSQKGPTDALQIRDPGVSLSTIFLDGNYHSEGGTIELNTFRDEVMINNLFITGNASGTSSVIVRNITGLSTTSTVGVVVNTTGTYAQPAGTPATANPNAAPKRDTPVVTTLGAQRDLKLVMNWTESEKYLPAATVSSTVPFLTMTSTTYEITSIMQDGVVISSTSSVIDSGTVNRVHLYNADGSMNSLGSTGSTALGSGTTTASGTTVVTGTSVVTYIGVTYGRSETVDYGESRDNYKLVEGRDGNWYFRNDSIELQDGDLPFIGAAPVMADMIAQSTVKAIYERISTRHDKLEEGWTAWTNYTHSEDRLRKDYYDSTVIKQDVFQVGGDYAFVKSDEAYSFIPSFNVGGALAITMAEATRRGINTLNIDSDIIYTRLDKSTLRVNTSTLNAYASARWWRLYLDMIAQYSPNTTYKASIDASVPFDMDGQVKGSRVGVSTEFGIIINPPGLGQLEIYGQATGQKHHFGSVSSITEPVDLTNPEGYNPIYDPDSPNGRRYSFTAPTTFRAEAGFRWGSHLRINDDLAVRPWGGLAYGRMMSSDYFIYVDDHNVRNDMRGNYYSFQGGAVAVFRHNWQLYLTLGWTGGTPTNNYTLSSGVTYHW